MLRTSEKFEKNQLQLAAHSAKEAEYADWKR